ncbi:MAG: SH3 domain-containing protein [Rubrivivax sp.]
MRAIFVLLCLMLHTWAARADEPAPPQLQVSDPFVELHTGPGRGYPVFHVVTRGERAQLLLTHTGWVKLRTADGVEGWAAREQLQGTLTAAGVQPGLLRAAVDRWLVGRVEAGAAWGRFQRQPMLELGLRWRLADTIELDAAAGQVQGVYSGTDFWRLGLSLDPLVDEPLAPVFGIGVGRFRNVPNASLVEQGTTHANLAHASIGLRWRFGSRYLLRAAWAHHVALLSDERSREYRAATVGLSFTF